MSITQRISFSKTRLWKDENGTHSTTAIRDGAVTIGTISGERACGTYTTLYTVKCPVMESFSRSSLSEAKQELLDQLGAVKVFFKAPLPHNPARDLMEQQRLISEPPTPEVATGIDIQRARVTLGTMWGLKRPLRKAELARILRIKVKRGANADAVRDWETGRRRISGPVSVAIELMLAGARPPTLDVAIKLAKGPTWDAGT